MSGKRKVTYFYDPEIGNYYYGAGHPMKPFRIRMTHSLVVSIFNKRNLVGLTFLQVNYGLFKKMQTFRPKPASDKEMTQFHADEYISFLKTVNLENMYKFSKQLGQCKSSLILL